MKYKRDMGKGNCGIFQHTLTAFSLSWEKWILREKHLMITKNRKRCYT